MFAAIGLITATGAFTTVEAERTATIEVSGDASALLGLSESENIGTGAVDDAQDGQATINLSDEALGDAQGLNPNANTTITPLLNVTNNGESNVNLEITIDSEDAAGIEDIMMVDADGEELTSAQIDSGETVELGLKVQTGEDELGDFDVQITFEANAE